MVIIALVVLYAAYYYRYPKTTSILQTTLDRFSMNLLLEKQPIVIQEGVHDLSVLRRLWFGSNIAYTDVAVPNSSWTRNRYKFLLLQFGSPAEVLMYPAGKPMKNEVPPPQETLLAVQLSPHQVLIVPFHWSYMFTEPEVRSLGVHDLVTFFL